MMLKPFQIKDLHEASSRYEGERFARSNRVVQISTTDYDDLASNHPRARLTYLDEDDGDNIEVRYHILFFYLTGLLAHAYGS